MNSSKRKRDGLLTRAIITISVVGICYFGYQAISDDSKQYQKNPFEYNIENFKKNDADLIHYLEIKQIPIELQQLTGIAIGKNDELYVSGDKSVLGINYEGNVQETISLSETARCLAIDGNNDLFFGMNDHIEVYDQAGTKKAHWESLGDKALITSVAVSNDYVFLADAGNTIVWKYDKQGNLLAKIGAKNVEKEIPGFIIPSPYFDVCVDPDGFLWAVNTGHHSLENYTFEGDLRTYWGEFTMEIEGFCGCCNPTHIAILEDGKFVTSEKGIPRVKVYNRLGNLQSIVAGSDQFMEGTTGLDLAIDSKQRIYVLDPKKKAVRIFEKKQS